MPDSSLINGVEMANIKNVDGIDAPPASVTLLTDLDFTTMASASWLAESSVTLDGQAWKIGNGSNANDFGPNGSNLILHPKDSGTGNWWVGVRTGPYFSIKLSALDSNLDATAQYVVQTVCNSFPSPGDNYGRFMAGFWSDDANGRGYTCLFGTQWDGGNKRYFYVGENEQATSTAGGDELTFYTELNPSGFNACRTSTSADGNTPNGGTYNGAIYASPSSPQNSGAQQTLTLTASAPVNVGIVFVGDTTGVQPTFTVNRLRIWKIEPQI
jgi:hypothetical protein